MWKSDEYSLTLGSPPDCRIPLQGAANLFQCSCISVGEFQLGQAIKSSYASDIKCSLTNNFFLSLLTLIGLCGTLLLSLHYKSEKTHQFDVI